jgi:lipopolysaccharide transport system ATP-binding protein
LGKQYRIGAQERYKTLRDTLMNAVKAPFRRFSSNAAVSGTAETFWALKDVSFEVKSGEVIGIIGRNGAGKSTLLKVLSRITEPTEGRAEIRGRVGSLLEVGTGFHGELSGRENIFLNGAILGMKRAEIERKFDEIVAFAEVEKFIDTPVKHYSSGMYMRLAFGVAAHLEPEILIVDEVLAVGDAQFQKKCLGKMGDVAKEGRTVIFVSHQLNQVRRLCGRGVWLDNGLVRQIGTSAEVISTYECSFVERPMGTKALARVPKRSQFVSWTVDGADADQSSTVRDDCRVSFRFRLHVRDPIRNAHHGIAMFNSENLLIWAYASTGLEFNAGYHDIRYTFPSLPIQLGAYRWQLSLYDGTDLIDLWDAFPLMHVQTPLRTHHSDAWQGVLNPQFSMGIEPVIEDRSLLSEVSRTL